MEWEGLYWGTGYEGGEEERIQMECDSLTPFEKAIWKPTKLYKLLKMHTSSHKHNSVIVTL